MKKFMIYALAVAALSCGCTKELNNENVVPEDGATTTVIKASVATKTVLDGTKVKWVAGDQICVNGETSDALTIAEPAASVDFTFGSDLAAEKKAVYPASFWTSDGTITLPATQTLGTSASFDTDVEPLCAYAASGNTLTFSHTCAIIKVQLKVGADDDKISYVEFSGNNDEQVSGAFTINYSTGALASTSSAGDDKIVQVTVGQALTSTVLPVYIVVPAGNYSAGFKIRVEDEKHHVMTRRVGAVTLAAGHIYPLPVDTFDHDGTIKAFVKHYVKILDVWQSHVGRIDPLSIWELASEGGIEDAHYIPNTTTITVGEKEYSIGDMFETALRSYLRLRGYDGTDTENYGYTGSTPKIASASPVSMSADVTSTHNYYFATPLIENTNLGYLYRKDGANKVYHEEDVRILDNWALRSLNYKHGRAITNLCNYDNNAICPNFYGTFSSGRALMTYAFFFKYMLDNELDSAGTLDSSTIIRSELFGKEGNY